MLQLKNETPFKAAIAVLPNEKAIDTVYLIVKATFSIGRKLEVAEKQSPVVLADEYWGEPGKSSLKYASEFHLTKPSTDIIMIGNACAPGKRRVEQLDVLFQVGSMKKTIRVFGDRKWVGDVFGLSISRPLPFETMPMVFERAFGGTHESNQEKQPALFDARNPVGMGFKGKKNNKELKDTALPNLEDPVRPISKPEDQPIPACFAYVAPSWEPRKSFAGTYDEQWTKTRAPYLPKDFNSRFFNVAHPDMICPDYLKGGEPVSILNMSGAGPLKFALPKYEFDVSIDIAGRTEKPPVNMETVLIEPNENRLCLSWRGSVECDKKALKVRQVTVGVKAIAF